MGAQPLIANSTGRRLEPAQMPDRLIINGQVVRAVEVSVPQDAGDAVRHSKAANHDQYAAVSFPYSSIHASGVCRRFRDPSERNLLRRDVQPDLACSLREAAHRNRFVVEQVKDRGELRDHEQVVDALGGVQ